MRHLWDKWDFSDFYAENPKGFRGCVLHFLMPGFLSKPRFESDQHTQARCSPFVYCTGRGKHLRVERAVNACELGRKPPQVAAGKQNGWRCPEKPCFLLRPALATGLFGMMWGSYRSSWKRVWATGHGKERSEGAGKGRRSSSVSEATWELV